MTNYELFQSLFSTIPEDVRSISLYGYVFLIVVSIIAALLISHLYSKFYDANSTGSRIHRSFPLMAPAVTTIFLTVQYSLPLSLGLLGALSIVRFRTPIKEPEEIGFILLVIACSISIATFNIAFAALLYVVVFIGLHIIRHIPGFDSSTASAVVLNVLLNGTSDGDPMTDIAAISDRLNQEKVKHTIGNVSIDSGKTNASIVLKNTRQDHFPIIQTIAAEFPQASLDYYRR